LPQQGYLLNYRFGLVVVIPVAILIGYLTARLPGPVVRPAVLASLLALAVISGLSLGRNQVVLATEAAQDLSAQQQQIQAGNFLVQHTTGLILMDNVQNERVGFDVETVRSTTVPGKRGQISGRPCSGTRKPTAFG
jgi:hypothetical protein